MLESRPGADWMVTVPRLVTSPGVGPTTVPKVTPPKLTLLAINESVGTPVPVRSIDAVELSDPVIISVAERGPRAPGEKVMVRLQEVFEGKITWVPVP